MSQKNRGIIRVSEGRWEHLERPSIWDTHKALQLPNDYEVVRVDEYEDGHAEVWILSASIPEMDAPGIVEVVPEYRMQDGETVFDRMQFVMYPIARS